MTRWMDHAIAKAGDMATPSMTAPAVFSDSFFFPFKRKEAYATLRAGTSRQMYRSQKEIVEALCRLASTWEDRPRTSFPLVQDVLGLSGSSSRWRAWFRVFANTLSSLMARE